jgi:hypothetical protein
MLEIRPEPSPEERTAIEGALGRLNREEPNRGAWWEAGLAENHEVAEGELGDRAPPQE